MPAIGLPRFGMVTGDDDLLSVSKEFDFFCAAVGRDDIGDDLVEWLISAKRDRSFRWLADTDEDVSTIFVPLADIVFERARRFLIKNIEIERRHASRQHAGIARVWPSAPPHLDLFAGDNGERLPIGEALARIVLAVSGRRFTKQRQRKITPAQE